MQADAALAAWTVSLDAGPSRHGRYQVHGRFVKGEGEGTTESKPLVVLLNGVFSDGETWRFVTEPLAKSNDLLVLDLPGTGLSAIEEPDEEPAEAFTLAWTGARLFYALEDFTRRTGKPRRIVIVGHSLAGAVILQMLGDRTLGHAHAETVARIRGAALIAPADVGADGWNPTFVMLAKLSDAEVALGSTFGVLRDRVEVAIFGSVEAPSRRAFQREAERILESIEDRPRRRASQLMLRRVRPVNDDDEPDWKEVGVLVENQRRVEQPVLLLWGRHDDAIPLETGRKLAREIANAHLTIVEDARHSLHQEKPLETAALLTRFVSDVAGSD